VNERPRRAWVAVPVVVLLVLTGAYVAVRRPWAAPADRSTPSTALPALPDDVWLVNPPMPAFADADHGYLLLGRCPATTCETWVASTRDAGRTWDGALVPGLTFPSDVGRTPRGSLHALDATHAIIESYDTILGGPAARRWYTSDGGRSWSEVPTTPVATVDEVPPGALAGTTTTAQLPQQIVVTVTRLDGTSAVLANPPRAPGVASMLINGVIVAGDGSLWIQAGSDDDEWLFVSRDRGRTWSRLSWPRGQPVKGHGYRFQPTDGRTLYVIDEGAFRLWRTTDAGAMWTELTVPYDNGGRDLGLVGTGQPDGRLVLHRPVIDGDELSFEFYEVTPTGGSFERVAAAPTAGPTPRLGNRGTHEEPQYGLVQPDGSWTPLPFACRPGGCD
jgi:hypothetical protein